MKLSDASKGWVGGTVPGCSLGAAGSPGSDACVIDCGSPACGTVAATEPATLNATKISSTESVIRG